ncbi:MAG: hypothetical protein LBB58_04085, partial [Cellulomonadaceae bacterium]|nr:hypothetical protein [Cellulomonadaceae bacterium]
MINATFSPTPATVSTLRSLSAVPAGPLFTEHDFGKVAWQVLLREGKLVRVFGDYATAKSANLTPEDRALALAKAIPAPMVASGVTAAWVYC